MGAGFPLVISRHRRVHRRLAGPPDRSRVHRHRHRARPLRHHRHPGTQRPASHRHRIRPREPVLRRAQDRDQIQGGMGRTIRSRASGRIRHRLLRHAQGDGGTRRGPQPHRAGVARSGGRQCGRLRHARWPRRGRLPRRHAGRRTQPGATRLRHRRRAGSRRYQCVRHGHR